MALISRLGVVLGLDSAEFSKGLGMAETKLKGFGATSVASGIIIEKIGEKLLQAAISGIAFADSINDIAKANEVSVSSVLEFSQALAISGGKAEMAGRVLGGFSNKVEEAASGSDKTRAVFARLGVSLQDLGNLDEADLLKKTLAGLNKIPDAMTRNAIAADVMGKGVRGVDLKGLNAELIRLTGTMEGSDKSFAKIGDGIDAIDKLSIQMKKDMADAISTPFYEATTAALEFYTFLKKQHEETATFLGSKGMNLGDLLIPGRYFYRQASDLAGGVKHMYDRAHPKAADNTRHYTPMKEGDYTPSILTGGAPSAKRLIAESQEAQKIREKLEADQKRLSETLGTQLSTLKLQREELSGQKSEYDKIKIKFAETASIDNAKTKNLKQQVLEEAKKYDLAVKQKEVNQITYDLAVAHTKEMQADFEIQRQFQQGVDDVKIAAQRLDYERQLSGLSSSQTEKALAYFDLRQRIVRMSEEEVNMSESQKKVLEANIALLTEAEQLKITATESWTRYQHTFQYGWDKAYADFVERSNDSAALAADAFNTMTGSMSSALNTFVETGKISFGGLVSSMIKDLLKLAMQAQISGFFKMALGSFGFGGGDNGLTGEGALNWGTGNAWDLSGKAGGGDINANTPYLVGEKGPELIVPRNNSTVIPNNALGGSMNQQPQTVYNGTVIQNMNAIDTQSGVQFLAKNKNAIFAANQSAQRGLPQTR